MSESLGIAMRHSFGARLVVARVVQDFATENEVEFAIYLITNEGRVVGIVYCSAHGTWQQLGPTRLPRYLQLLVFRPGLRVPGSYGPRHSPALTLVETCQAGYD